MDVTVYAATVRFSDVIFHETVHHMMMTLSMLRSIPDLGYATIEILAKKASHHHH
jgi:hypothetical protein